MLKTSTRIYVVAKNQFSRTVLNSGILYLHELQDLVFLRGSKWSDCCFGDEIEIVEQVAYESVGLECLVE